MKVSRENNKGHEAGRDRAGAGRGGGAVGKDEAGETGRTQVPQGMRHLNFTWRTVVTCPQLSLDSEVLEMSLRLLCGKWIQETGLRTASHTRRVVAWPHSANRQEGWLDG